MIRSMTGYGRASFRIDGQGFEIEVRSVNHRYLDARVRLPRSLASFEPALRERVQARVSRGKVDLVAASPDGSGVPQRLEIDAEVARQYVEAAARLREQYALEGALDVARLLALPGVARFAEPQLAEETLRETLFRAADEALDAFDAMRSTEGEALDRELRARADAVVALTDEIESRAGGVQAAVRERLRKRALTLEQETGMLDEARLHQEIVIAADRLDVTEEIVRLRSHVEQLRTVLSEASPGRPVGRRLDFLLQECAREANTIGSKSSDAPVAHFIVELKTELERLREQVQNVE